MDAFGHVNNTVFFRWFETARIVFLEAIGFTAGGEAKGSAGRAEAVGPILGSTSCRFRRPVVFPDTVTVGVRTLSVDEDRFTHAYRAVSRGLGEIVAEGEGVVVSYDYAAKRKTAFPPSVRAAIDGLALDGRS